MRTNVLGGKFPCRGQEAPQSALAGLYQLISAITLSEVLFCQTALLVAVRETGLMWANMLRAFQVGNALTSDGRPSSWMRPSRVA